MLVHQGLEELVFMFAMKKQFGASPKAIRLRYETEESHSNRPQIEDLPSLIDVEANARFMLHICAQVSACAGVLDV